jgi:phage shock protein A
MSIFSRLTDIVNSNINALLDKAEDPEKMVRLILQEMEETLVEVRTTSAKAIADRKELVRRREWLQKESEEWQRKAEIALSKEREELARAALVEKSKVLEAVGIVDDELKALEESLAKLNEDVGLLQQKIKDAKARQNAIVMRGKTAQTRLGVRRQLSRTGIEDAMTRFEQYERKMDELEGQVEAYDMGQRTLAEEIGELEADEEIDQELDELKKRLRKRHGKSSDEN